VAPTLNVCNGCGCFAAFFRYVLLISQTFTVLWTNLFFEQDQTKIVDVYPSVKPPEINVFESLSTNAVTLLLLALTAVDLSAT
jgi:hypothetical protein